MINQRATRPQARPEVVSIADLSMFAAEDDPMRTTDEVLEAVRAIWPFEICEFEAEAGAGVTIKFADGSSAYFAAWK